MNFKRTAAGIAALALVGTAALAVPSKAPAPDNSASAASLFGDVNADGYIDAADASVILAYYAYASTAVGTPMSLEKYIASNYETSQPTTTSTSSPTTPEGRDVKLATGGKTFTVAAWNSDWALYFLAEWLGVKKGQIDLMVDYDQSITTPSGAELKYINFGVAGGSASEKYDAFFNAGYDLDVYFAEPDWAHRYMDNDKLSAPLSDLGITADDTADMYPYTLELSKNSSGILKAAPIEACAGAFAYRTDLAEQYLGVTSPEEMQAAIGDWDKFTSAAKSIAGQGNGKFKVALADSVGGMWLAYKFGRTSPYVSNGTIYIGDDVKAFADMAKEVYNSGGVMPNSQWDDSWIDSGYSGKCMGYFVAPWSLSGFLSEAARESVGEWALCQGPQPFYWGGTQMLVNPATDNGDDASSFMLSAINPNNLSALNDRSMPNSITTGDKLASENYSFENYRSYNFTLSEMLGGQNYYDVLNQSAKSVDLTGIVTPYDATVEMCILDGITQYYIKGYTWSETVAKIKNNIKNYYLELY